MPLDENDPDLVLAREVLAGKARSYVAASKQLAARIVRDMGNVITMHERLRAEVPCPRCGMVGEHRMNCWTPPRVVVHPPTEEQRASRMVPDVTISIPLEREVADNACVDYDDSRLVTICGRCDGLKEVSMCRCQNASDSSSVDLTDKSGADR